MNNLTKDQIFFRGMTTAVVGVVIVFGACYYRDAWLSQPASVDRIKEVTKNTCVKETLENKTSVFLDNVLINHGKRYWTNDAVRIVEQLCKDNETKQKQLDAVTQ